MILAFEVDSA
jgi:hypothetical protein